MIHRLVFALVANDADKTKQPPKPTVDWECCFNRKQKRHECTVCRDICPKNAIVYDGQIKINKNLCNGCHLCHGVCPTQCIYQQSGFIRGGNGEDNPVLMFCCRQCKAGSMEVSLPCIASMPWEFYALASYQNPISIRAEACATCPLGLNAENYILAIHQNLQIFWGDAYGKKILCHTAAPATEYSRRELFGIFVRKPKKPAFADVFEMDKAIKKHPAFYRNLLLNQLYNESQSHGWKTWLINQNCDGCGICEKLCPCGALQMTEEGRPHHNATLCLNCGLCKIICPQKALQQN
ncbi:MAG: 4Fe-4S binding protein [Defluviitaleaceae bacterium]|nr:4Fe-4S binding protein [Defluviitaleaceae bacterium]